MHRLCLNPATLTKVTTTEDKFCVGDLVQIESDLEMFKALQTPWEYGGYVEQMASNMENCAMPDGGLTGSQAGEENKQSVPKALITIRRYMAKNCEKILKEDDKEKAIDAAKLPLGKYRLGEAEKEPEVERKKKCLIMLGKMSQSLELLKTKDSAADSIVLRLQTLKQVFMATWSQSNPAERKLLGDHLAEIGAAEALMECGSFLSSQTGQNDGAGGKLASECLAELYRVVLKYAHASREFSHAVGKSGILHMTVQELSRRYAMEESDDITFLVTFLEKQNWMQCFVCTLLHWARLPENANYIRDIGVVDLLKNHLKDDNVHLKLIEDGDDTEKECAMLCVQRFAMVRSIRDTIDFS
ncbi:Hypp9696 [Branchiostoma lanceolatum]|uniref:Hypp9696 protein n=1 Tax=Branchiostoma lanceolatum TaxID=7740 RepID=A0A8S4MPB1_BRALA|nr:Hypp9696 [Branchiostoma lanceolatum]